MQNRGKYIDQWKKGSAYAGFNYKQWAVFKRNSYRTTNQDYLIKLVVRKPYVVSTIFQDGQIDKNIETTFSRSTF